MKPMIGKIVDRIEAGDPFGGHGAPADAGETHLPAGALPQRAHQIGAEPVAGFLAGDQEDVERARRTGRAGSRHRPDASSRTPRTKSSGAVRKRRDALRLGDDRAAGHDRDAFKPRARRAFDGLRPDRRQIDAPVLAGLGRLDQNAADRRRIRPLRRNSATRASI